jgi:diadenosine tetraphosphate (Ap4A) HIT family hydrolase
LREFVLDPRIKADTLPVTELPLASVRLMCDANYPWLILVPRRAGLVEIIDLDQVAREQLIEEIALASDALRAVTLCEKLNVGALGNQVPQLHVHVIARRRSDPAWPKPVWNALPARTYPPGAAEALAARLAARFRVSLAKA